MSTLTEPAAPTDRTSRSWLRAIDDIANGIRERELWGHLGWQDIKQRYRRSVIGPLWITVSMAITAVGLGLLYAVLFDQNVPTFLPYVTVGFIVWNFINGCLIEGMDTFIANEGLIKHLPAPLTVYALRTVWRQTLFLAHNLVVYVIILVVFYTSLDHQYTLSKSAVCDPKNLDVICHPGLGWWSLSAIPAFLLLALNGGWVTLLFGIISTRFRDLPQVINSLTMLLFYATPIVWSADTIFAKHDQVHELAHTVMLFNPLYHYVQILRAPMIGNALSWLSWVVVGAFTVVGWALALVAMRNYRARVSYWV